MDLRKSLERKLSNQAFEILPSNKRPEGLGSEVLKEICKLALAAGSSGEKKISSNINGIRITFLPAPHPGAPLPIVIEPSSFPINDFINGTRTFFANSGLCFEIRDCNIDQLYSLVS